MAMIAIMAAGTMMLSAFTIQKQEATQTEMTADDDWKCIKENVPYCDADKGVCEGYGKVWVNTDTKQVAFSINGQTTKYDLSSYRGKEGYNHRFWYEKAYHYVNVTIPRSAFDK